MKRAWLKNLIYTAAAVAVMWIGWAAAYKAVGNEYILPSFSSAAKSAGELLLSSSFWTAFASTLLRTAEAFFMSFIAALVLSVLSALNDAVRRILRPVMSAIRVAPTVAIILLILIWTTPAAAPVAVVVTVLFPMIYSSLLAAFDGVSKEYIELCRAYKIGVKDRILKVYVPQSLPYILSEAGGQFSFALKIAVSAEVISNTYKSLGGMMSEAKMYVEISELMALTIIVVAAGLMIELVFLGIKKLAVRWNT